MQSLPRYRCCHPVTAPSLACAMIAHVSRVGLCGRAYGDPAAGLAQLSDHVAEQILAPRQQLSTRLAAQEEIFQHIVLFARPQRGTTDQAGYFRINSLGLGFDPNDFVAGRAVGAPLRADRAPAAGPSSRPRTNRAVTRQPSESASASPARYDSAPSRWGSQSRSVRSRSPEEALRARRAPTAIVGLLTARTGHKDRLRVTHTGGVAPSQKANPRPRGGHCEPSR